MDRIRPIPGINWIRDMTLTLIIGDQGSRTVRSHIVPNDRSHMLTRSVRRISHEDLSQTTTFSAPQRADTMPHLHHDCPGSDSHGQELNSYGRYSRREDKGQHAPRKFPTPCRRFPSALKGYVMHVSFGIVVCWLRTPLM